jgi:hypothetical protein
MNCRRCGYPSLRTNATCPFCGALPGHHGARLAVAVAIGTAAPVAAVVLLLRG